jgi:hypothetical protein
MAKLAPGLEISGPLGNLSIYKRRDLPQTIVRQKGGPSGYKIDHYPTCAPIKRNGNEFRGLTKAIAHVTRVLRPLKVIHNYNLNAELLHLMFPLKEMDKSSLHGQRNIKLSSCPSLLNSFSVNNRNPLDSLVRSPLTFSLSRQELTASVEIPALSPRFNFFPIGNFPVYRWIISFGLIPDMIFDEERGFVPTEDQQNNTPAVFHSAWVHVSEQAPALKMDLSVPFQPTGNLYSVMLVAGVSFGMIKPGGEIVPAKYCGGGKVLAMT